MTSIAEASLDLSPAPPFDALAEIYDDTFTNSLIGLAQRAAVIRELDVVFAPGQHLLEINCGTGVDAVYLAGRGLRILACDSSPRMIAIARRRAARSGLEDRAEFRVLATEDLAALAATEGRIGFDGALSNFAGLNCVENLAAVAGDLARLLKPGARVVFCLFGWFCAWEILWYLGHGKLSGAFRRFRTAGDLARLTEGATVRVRYPSVPAINRALAPHFRLQRWKGVGVTVPPSYLEHWAQRFPQMLAALAKVDRKFEHWPLFRTLADHAVLTFERTDA